MPTRRATLATLGSVLAASLAGCSGSSCTPASTEEPNTGISTTKAGYELAQPRASDTLKIGHLYPVEGTTGIEFRFPLRIAAGGQTPELRLTIPTGKTKRICPQMNPNSTDVVYVPVNGAHLGPYTFERIDTTDTLTVEVVTT